VCSKKSTISTLPSQLVALKSPVSGLGKNWLQRSQATLARIQREEGAHSGSSGGSGERGKHSIAGSYWNQQVLTVS